MWGGSFSKHMLMPRPCVQRVFRPSARLQGAPWPLGEATHLQKFVASDHVGKGWVCGSPEGEEAPFLLRD